MTNMNLVEKLNRTVRNLLVPRSLPYDKRRDRTVIFLTIVGGLFFAVLFGFLLYTLNVNGRIK